MAIHIDEIDTQVQLQGNPPAASPGAAPPPWQQLAQLRALQQQLLCDAKRTQALGNDD